MRRRWRRRRSNVALTLLKAPPSVQTRLPDIASIPRGRASDECQEHYCFYELILETIYSHIVQKKALDIKVYEVIIFRNKECWYHTEKNNYSKSSEIPAKALSLLCSFHSSIPKGCSFSSGKGSRILRIEMWKTLPFRLN